MSLPDTSLPAVAPTSAPAPSKLSASRVAFTLKVRSNPLQGLDPLRLGQILNAWRNGYLTQGADLFDIFLDRDIQLISTAPKRWRAVSSLDWQVTPLEGAPGNGAVDRHTAAVNYLLRNLVARRALKRDERGGLRMLVSHLMEGTMHGWGASELSWRPVRAAGAWSYHLTATQTPMRFFEATTGELRFLEQDMAMTGTALDPAQWAIHAARALGPASAVACTLKSLSLQDWSSLSEKYGFPITHGKTDAQEGSDEWNDYADALAGLGQDGVLLTNMGAEIQFHNLTLGGENPQQAMVKYMDIAQAVLWRGGDLSTFAAAGGAVGSNPQLAEQEALEVDDGCAISETIQDRLVAPMTRALFGEEPAVLFSMVPRNRADTARRLTVYQAGVGMGVPIAVDTFREEFGIPAPAKEQTELLSAPAAPAFGGPPALVNATPSAGNTTASSALLKAYEIQAAKLLARLNELPADPAAMRDALEQLLEDLPDLLPDDPAIVTAWENVLAAAMIKGVVSVPGTKG